jgi:putative membrane protein
VTDEDQTKNIVRDGCLEVDYRFSLANERTYLAWIRTALALIAGGVAAAKALNFNHEWIRWLLATPPLLAGGFLGLAAHSRWQLYEDAMRAGRSLPVGRQLKSVAVGLAVYAIIALAAMLIDR